MLYTWQPESKTNVQYLRHFKFNGTEDNATESGKLEQIYCSRDYRGTDSSICSEFERENKRDKEAKENGMHNSVVSSA
jgi:hypothetical protein